MKTLCLLCFLSCFCACSIVTPATLHSAKTVGKKKVAQGFNMVAFYPTEYQLRYGVSKKTEFNLRASLISVKLAGRCNLLADSLPSALSVGLAYNQIYIFGVAEVPVIYSYNYSQRSAIFFGQRYLLTYATQKWIDAGLSTYGMEFKNKKENFSFSFEIGAIYTRLSNQYQFNNTILPVAFFGFSWYLQK
jgi:hypothetical protein